MVGNPIGTILVLYVLRANPGRTPGQEKPANLLESRALVGRGDIHRRFEIRELERAGAVRCH